MKKIVLQKTIIASLIATSISPNIMAAEEKPDANIFKLGTVIVTTNAEEEASDNSNRLTIESIRTYDKETVGTALNTMASVSMSKVGARNEEMVYVRGFDLRQVPVFVDGIPVYVPYDGYVDLGRFNTFDLAHIDVAKGFSSLIYGPNTLGGAINLVSRRPNDAFEGEIGSGSTFNQDGANNSNRVYANVGSNQGSWYIQAGLSYLDQDFYSLPEDFTPAKAEDGGKRENSYNRDSKINLKIAFTPNETDEYSLNYISQDGKKGNPPYAGSVPGVNARFWQWPDWDKDSLYYISNTQFGIATLKVKAFHDTYKNSLFTYDDATYTTQNKPSSFKSWYDDYTNGASIGLDFQLSDINVLKTAYHWKEDVHREHNAGEPIRRDRDLTQSIALEDTHNITNKLSLVAGVSHDWRETLKAEDYNAKTGVISDFEQGDNSANNATLGLFYQWSDTSRIHLTGARKHRFATIKDRYSYRMGTALPNPDLRSEEAGHIEISYQQTFADKWNWNATIFHSDVTDLIQAVSIPASSCSSPPCSQMQNIGEVRINGIDTGLRAYLDSWELGATYTYLERENISNPAIHLIDTPRHKFAGDIRWRISDVWDITTTTEVSSSRYSTSNGLQQTDGVGVTNLKTGYRLFNKELLLEVGARNLFDRVYEYTEGFPEAGRTYFVQFNYTL